ncbi:TBC1 domain family member 5 [Senna tora]|uniref:TBC1 domain family member 5 n=1 Tax=Senna tora TaxID=362788 RepID=A0A834X449_9FABA|nr:TBC1 domain family member 5 [Senna tora]
MPPAMVNPPLPEALSVASSCSDSVSLGSEPQNGRFGNLRGLQWRINLGVLPSSSSIDYLRRATADSRRRYACLRRRLLVDPHIPKDGSNSPDLVIDNPLSQNPDSTWSRFFRNAELERMVDQDLSRLYPEHGIYFQTPGCQGMLRRILLLWCIKHPECGYRQGMHELLAPLLYVLQGDVERLSEFRKLYEDHFTDKFDGLLCQENDLSYSFDFRKSPDLIKDESDSCGNAMKAKSLDELDPEIQTIVLLSDAYGAEGELGIVLSEKFIEHDAYSLFDALLSGAHGLVAMADFFSSSPVAGSHSSVPPVIEASTALYYLLSRVDSSLHSHLVDLGVEPQYFALRWLRVLFGREFSLDSLLIIWDEIFASDNSKVEKGTDYDIDSGFRILHSPRGTFISAMAVAMILHLRSSLLATENATTCLQRLLNFPQNTSIKKLIEKAKSLQALALSADLPMPSPFVVYNQSKSPISRSLTLQSESFSPKTPLNLVTDSYWEEKWRVLHKDEEIKQVGADKEVPTRKNGWTEKVKLRLKRTESDPSPSKVRSGKTESKSSVRRSLLKDLTRILGSEEDTEEMNDHEVSHQQDIPSVEVEGEEPDSDSKDNIYPAEDRFLSGNTGSEENSSSFSDPISPPNEANDNENYSEKSSVASNLSFKECDEDSHTVPHVSPLPISVPSDNMSQMNSGCNSDTAGNSATVSKERKPNKINWFWKFGRNTDEVMAEKGGGASNTTKAGNSSSTSSTAASTNVMGTLRNIGQSMIENIQVIESVFQQDRGQGTSLDNFSKNVLVGKGQVTAMTALKELRKISNLLSEM